MNIGIAGAGLVGRILALELIERGHAVTLFDQHGRDARQDEDGNGIGPAGLTAAGMLAPFAELETADSMIFALGRRSVELWPKLLEKLDAAVFFQQAGSLITAHHADMAELDHFIGLLRAHVGAAADIRTLDSRAIADLEPELAHHRKAFYLPDEGQVNSAEFMPAIAKTLLKRGVTWHESRAVTRLAPGVIVTAEGEQRFDWVFDCRGVGAREAMQGLRGVRGEVFWLDAPEVNLNRPVRLMHPRYRIYIVPRPNHRYVIGASEIESEDYSPMSVRSSLELLSAAYSLHPGFAEARIVRMLTNCRPARADNLPRIEAEDGLMRINGLYRHGYLLGPAVVAEALAAFEGRSQTGYPQLFAA